MILVDSNILIDIIERDEAWFDWSFAALERAGRSGAVSISTVTVGEVAPRFGSLGVFLNAMSSLLIVPEPLTVEATFQAGIAFQVYRRRRQPGQAKSLLADFLIGGHAMSIGAHLLTRDPRFYASYFPELTLITPETDND